MLITGTSRLRKEEGREELNNKRQELLDRTIQANKEAAYKKEVRNDSDSESK